MSKINPGDFIFTETVGQIKVSIIHDAKKNCEKYGWNPDGYKQFVETYDKNNFNSEWDDDDLIIYGCFNNLYEAATDYVLISNMDIDYDDELDEIINDI